MSELSESNLSCPICLNDIIENNNCAITPCGHKFCFNCIVQSLQSIYTCPICREILLIENEDGENHVHLTLKEKIILYFRRIYNEGFTQKELLYTILLLLSYQNCKFIKQNVIQYYYYLECYV